MSVTVTRSSPVYGTDPNPLTYVYEDPAGNLFSYTYGSGDGFIVRDSQGQYHANVAQTQSGAYTDTWTGNGFSVSGTWSGSVTQAAWIGAGLQLGSTSAQIPYADLGGAP